MKQGEKETRVESEGGGRAGSSQSNRRPQTKQVNETTSDEQMLIDMRRPKRSARRRAALRQKLGRGRLFLARGVAFSFRARAATFFAVFDTGKWYGFAPFLLPLGWSATASCRCSRVALLQQLRVLVPCQAASTLPRGYTCTVVPVQSVSHLLSHRRSSVGPHPGVKSHDSSCQRLATMLRACRLRIGESGQVGPRAVPVRRDKKMAVVLPVKPS